MKRLLAKSYDNNKYPDQPPDYALLTQHSRDVAEACRALADFVGKKALYNANIDLSVFAAFRTCLIANGWTQDLGKANSHFQEMVTKSPTISQLLRHETISGLLVWFDPKINQWLKPLEETLVLAIWAAMGHHRKFGDETKANVLSNNLTVYLSHTDFSQIINEMATDLNLSAPPSFVQDLVIASSQKVKGDWIAQKKLLELQDEFIDCEDNFGEENKKSLAIIKAFGIAADVAASAIAAQGFWAKNYSLKRYVENTLGKIGLSENDLAQLIYKWAWERSEHFFPKNINSFPPDFSPRPFQEQVANSQSFLTLAQAGCGSGKSLAAYMWAKQWCKNLATQNHKTFRLFFCLPTTGTTTEHFKDYALESGIDVSLTHSRANVDLKTIAETALQEEENLDTADAAYSALKSMQDKLESLALWSTPLVVTTADTVLGLMVNARRAIYSFPAIMNSSIVFDEIHAFDEQMFGHLLVFLKNFPNLPVLLMTASLPQERLLAIKKVRPDINIVPGPIEFELLKRYIIKYPVDSNIVWQEIAKTISENGKVLWVRNRVDWANSSYEECKTRFANKLSYPEINVYHSRLRYKDRSHRHRQVIDRFKEETKPAILVATQVAEMSLDLSADLLITDIAPVPALIQRLGRLNRRSTPDNPQPPKLALVCPLPNSPNNNLPYEKEDLDTTIKWLAALAQRGELTSQMDLAEEFNQFSNSINFDISIAEERAVFFSGLWRTRPSSTRSEGNTISVILENDLKNCSEKDRNNQPTQDWLRKYEVSIPIKPEITKWDKVNSLRVAPNNLIEYGYNDNTKEGTGARWLKN